MTPTQLRLLVALADAGSFSGAAAEVGASQPSVSRTVAQLERRLGAQLFARRPDGASPTEAGVVAVRHARTVLRQLERMREEVASADGRVVGTVRLASLPSATGSLLAAPMRALADRHPGVRVELFEGTDAEVRAWLEQGAADLGVVTLPAREHDVEVLGEDEMVAVVPRRHRLAGAGSVAWADLAGEPFIMPTGGCGPLICDAAGRHDVRLDVVLQAREPQSLVQMVAARLGVTVMPTLNLPRDRGRVTVVPMDPPLRRTLALARTGSGGPAAAAFWDLVAGRAEP